MLPDVLTAPICIEPGLIVQVAALVQRLRILSRALRHTGGGAISPHHHASGVRVEGGL